MSLVGTRPILQDELQKYELHHRFIYNSCSIELQFVPVNSSSSY